MSSGILRSTVSVTKPTTQVIGNGAFTAAGVFADGASTHLAAKQSSGDVTGDAIIGGILAKNLLMKEFALSRLDASERAAQRVAGKPMNGLRIANWAMLAATVISAAIGYLVLNRSKNSTRLNGTNASPTKNGSRKTTRASSRSTSIETGARDYFGASGSGSEGGSGGSGSGGSNDITFSEPVLVEGHVDAGPNHDCDL